MALVVCPECGGQVSDQAEACVHCGCPIDIIMNSLPPEDKEPEETVIEVVAKKVSNLAVSVDTGKEDLNNIKANWNKKRKRAKRKRPDEDRSELIRNVIIGLILLVVLAIVILVFLHSEGILPDITEKINLRSETNEEENEKDPFADLKEGIADYNSKEGSLAILELVGTYKRSMARAEISGQDPEFIEQEFTEHLKNIIEATDFSGIYDDQGIYDAVLENTADIWIIDENFKGKETYYFGLYKKVYSYDSNYMAVDSMYNRLISCANEERSYPVCLYLIYEAYPSEIYAGIERWFDIIKEQKQTWDRNSLFEKLLEIIEYYDLNEEYEAEIAEINLIIEEAKNSNQ